MVCFLLRKTDYLLPFISSKWAERSFFTMTKMAAHVHYVAFQNTNRVQVLQSNKNIKKLLVKQPDKWQSWEFQVSLRKDKIFTRNIDESYLSSRSWVTVTIKWTFKSLNGSPRSWVLSTYHLSKIHSHLQTQCSSRALKDSSVAKTAFTFPFCVGSSLCITN